MYSIIASIVFPIPIIHLWLHALLPWWRRRPVLFYLWGGLIFLGAFLSLSIISDLSPMLFTPTHITRGIGAILATCGVFAIASSILALGPKRFFLWAVLKPQSVPQMHIRKRPFTLIPHPAYIGYLCIALGNLLANGTLYLAGVLAWLIILTPIVIVFEEKEMRERFEKTQA